MPVSARFLWALCSPVNISLHTVGCRLRETREARGLSLREVARLADISPGTLSKIENFRAMPSLQMLYGLAGVLGVEVSALTSSADSPDTGPYILTRHATGLVEHRPDSPGLSYENLVETVANEHLSLRVNLVTVEPGTHREPIATEALELIHVLQGTVHYGVGDDLLELHPGDTLYFNGRLPHSVENRSAQPVRLFKVYLYGAA
jgi:transcriptional regulator with XRE-family HTH domain